MTRGKRFAEWKQLEFFSRTNPCWCDVKTFAKRFIVRRQTQYLKAYVFTKQVPAKKFRFSFDHCVGMLKR